MKSGNGLRNVALAAEEYRAGCPVFQTLPQLFKPNFSHPNNPQLFSALSLLSYFKLSLKQSVFPPRNLHHIGLQQCVMLSHIIAGCLRLRWLRYSFFCHIIYIFCFPAKRRLQKGGSHWWRCLPAATHPHTYVTTVFLHLLCLVVQIQVVYKQCDRVNGSEIGSEEEVLKKTKKLSASNANAFIRFYFIFFNF